MALVFAMSAIADYIWASYITAVSHRKPLAAAISVIGVVLMGNLITVLYVDDRWLIPAAALGAGLGTYLSVLRESSK